MRTPEPGSFESLTVPVEVRVTDLHRLSKFPATEPFWAKTVSHRFDDPTPDSTARFGVLYCAEDLATAFAESVVHENSMFRNARHEVPRAALQERELVLYAHPDKVELVLADLSGEALKRMGLNNDVSAGDDYSVTQQWALGIHRATELDGIRYASRQRPTHYCYAIFERSRLVRGDAAVLSQLDIDALSLKFNVFSVDD